MCLVAVYQAVSFSLGFACPEIGLFLRFQIDFCLMQHELLLCGAVGVVHGCYFLDITILIDLSCLYICRFIEFQDDEGNEIYCNIDFVF